MDQLLLNTYIKKFVGKFEQSNQLNIVEYLTILGIDFYTKFHYESNKNTEKNLKELTDHITQQGKNAPIQIQIETIKKQISDLSKNFESKNQDKTDEIKEQNVQKQEFNTKKPPKQVKITRPHSKFDYQEPTPKITNQPAPLINNDSFKVKHHLDDQEIKKTFEDQKNLKPSWSNKISKSVENKHNNNNNNQLQIVNNNNNNQLQIVNNNNQKSNKLSQKQQKQFKENITVQFEQAVHYSIPFQQKQKNSKKSVLKKSQDQFKQNHQKSQPNLRDYMTPAELKIYDNKLPGYLKNVESKIKDEIQYHKKLNKESQKLKAFQMYNNQNDGLISCYEQSRQKYSSQQTNEKEQSQQQQDNISSQLFQTINKNQKQLSKEKKSDSKSSTGSNFSAFSPNEELKNFFQKEFLQNQEHYMDKNHHSFYRTKQDESIY